jgi:hypothetical protein
MEQLGVLETEIDGEEITDHITKWMDANTVQGRFNKPMLRKCNLFWSISKFASLYMMIKQKSIRCKGIW